MAYKCEFCGKEYDQRRCYTEDVAYEGASVVNCDGTYFTIDNADYCSLQCFVNNVRSHFNKEPE